MSEGLASEGRSNLASNLVKDWQQWTRIFRSRRSWTFAGREYLGQPLADLLNPV